MAQLTRQFYEVATGEILLHSDYIKLPDAEVEGYKAAGHSDAEIARHLTSLHDHEHLTLVTEVLGPFGVDFLRRVDPHRRKRFFDSHYRIRPVPGGMRSWPLADVLAEKHKWSRVEAAAFAEFLRPAFMHDPYQRIPAYEWWDHAWLRPSVGAYRGGVEDVDSDDGQDSDSDNDSPERQACMEQLDRAVFGGPLGPVDAVEAPGPAEATDATDSDPTPLASPAI